jgi:hypothetical protein
MAQHLDDCAESFLMSALHNGSLRTMKAHYSVDEGDLRVVRPMVYVREQEAERFAEESMLPVRLGGKKRLCPTAGLCRALQGRAGADAPLVWGERGTEGIRRGGPRSQGGPCACGVV